VSIIHGGGGINQLKHIDVFMGACSFFRASLFLGNMAVCALDKDVEGFVQRSRSWKAKQARFRFVSDRLWMR
jgi:hypothetical protein